MQRCVDDHQVVVDDQFCENNPINSNRYRWYYGGGGSYAAGSPASGGSFEPHSGFSGDRGSGATSSSVSRGGFGSSAGHSGGSGE